MGAAPDIEGVRLWRISLREPDGVVSASAAILSGDERERAARFKFEAHRRRFTLRRAAYRRILASVIGCSPQQIHWRAGPQGKPAAYVDRIAAPAQFNASHSEDLAVLAVTASTPIGVDIECRARKLSVNAAHLALSAAEGEDIESLSDDERRNVILKIWTRKEAALKALGLGLSIAPNSFTAWRRGETGAAQLLSIPAHGALWARDLKISPDYAACLSGADPAAPVAVDDWRL